ncbi:hypothetical protein H2198_007602 [Neophaeococcomyces mojaviensis]|uniref:Uncharacterized protein n=1 Tax=Neophaeococcomyces mojaviensis TaxID=3383035 RepID=A0ACC2ZZJ0_9EURO|nr:hypothetical protein H2198_007602 [Knufia sp. JES_112]
MSFDAGGLAQMTYQPSFTNNSIGISGPGFASRGKGNHIKRLSVAPPPKISTIDETQAANHCSTPRTARGHLLAGLRTAPKSATVPHGNGLENSKFAAPQYNARGPQTSAAAYFPNQGQFNGNYQNFSSPDQVLAPPALDFGHDGANGVDQNIYDELVATNAYLAQQQRALQQQLLNVQQAAQQMGGLSLNGNPMAYAPFGIQSPVTPMSMYNQPFQQGLQPVVQPVPGNPGVFTVYNPVTGQSNLVYDNSAQHEITSPQAHYGSPIDANVLQRRSPPTVASPPAVRSVSPPKQTPSPQQDVEPLPPPSANAFRRGHRKGLSSVNVKTAGEWSRGGPRTAGLPPTPMTGSFGPGQARAGEHPIRQPRNPPHLSELQEKPTAKHEGSKNFAARQRRRAIHDLVRAGRERLSDRNSNSDSGTPGSEAEFNFSVSSEDNEVMGRSGNLSSRPSSGSLAAIGSERKEKSRERNSVDSIRSCGAKSLSSDEGNAVGGNIVEVEPGRRKTPLLILSSAEKRRSVVL